MFGKKNKKKNKKNKSYTKPKSLKSPKKTVTYSTKTKFKECHTDPTEIVPNIIVGSKYALDKITTKSTVLVPLESIDGDIWKTWRGDICYIPINDFDCLPLDVLTTYIKKLKDLHESRHKIGIFCLGGHGRTGYLTAALLWELGYVQKAGYDDPIQFVRDKYCKNAVESFEQVESLEMYTGIKGLAEKHPDNFSFRYYNSVNWSNYYEWKNGWVEDDTTAVSDNWKQEDFDDLDYVGRAALDNRKPNCNINGSNNPCYECIHAAEEYIPDNIILVCDYGNVVGLQCEFFTSWLTQIPERSDK